MNIFNLEITCYGAYGISYADYHIPWHLAVAKHHIMEMFGGGKQWRILQITAGFPHFTIQILKMSRDINKENKQAEICQSFTHQSFL